MQPRETLYFLPSNTYRSVLWRRSVMQMPDKKRNNEHLPFSLKTTRVALKLLKTNMLHVRYNDFFIMFLKFTSTDVILYNPHVTQTLMKL